MFKRITVLLCLTLCWPYLAAQEDSRYSALPEMGDSATTVLNAETAQQIGQAMMRQIQRSGKINDDPLVQEYIQRIGRELAAGGMVGDQHFHFFVINERSINAFAMPGGYIGVHAGLILASQSENELAAVIAHEIAHVTQHHIARSVEKAQQMNLPLTAAVIAAILLGASDPQIAQAALAATIGAGQQMQIDFTRANEKEADRVGMQLLASAGFDPRGMADFFLRLQEDSRYASNGLPEFLRTHPISSDRLAEAQERASRYPRSMRTDSIAYQLTRAHLLLQLSENPQQLAAQLADGEQPIPLGAEGRRYLQGLIHQKQREFPKARSAFRELLETAPERIAYIDALGKLELQDGQARTAEKLYRQGLDYYPGNLPLSLGLAEVLIADDRHEQARQLLSEYLSVQGSHPTVLHKLAKAEAMLGNHAASHLALTEYHLLRNEPHSALDQLSIARRQQALTEYHAARIEAYSEQITRLLEKP
ncbi:MAG: M48 family metalloprotease [Thiohalomonadaceae bacterium]